MCCGKTVDPDTMSFDRLVAGTPLSKADSLAEMKLSTASMGGRPRRGRAKISVVTALMIDFVARKNPTNLKDFFEILKWIAKKYTLGDLISP